MVYYILTALVVVGVAAFLAGRARALSLAGDKISNLHSRPTYHGGFLAIASVFPTLVLLVLWSIFSGNLIDGSIKQQYASELAGLEPAKVEAFIRDVHSLAAKVGDSAVITSVQGGLKEVAEEAAKSYRTKIATSNISLAVLSVLLTVSGFLLAYRRISLTRRTRHFVEKFVMGVLVACSVVAILTTIGIIFSLLFESFRFFQMVPLFDFLFGYHWSPQSAFEAAGGGSLAGDTSRIFGAIPLFAEPF